ncbi:MAG TPA: HIT domain-containing protein, partial [Thermomicrobiales bacterium]|nr:HIT domain-containing protein [Thermomicrobiales bacterium]
LAFARFWWMVPVRRVTVTREVFAFHHPRPSWATHILIVPKRGIAGLLTLGDREAPYLAAILATARELAPSLDVESLSLTINGGDWQDVGQMHAHLAAGENLFRPDDPESHESGVTMHPQPARQFHAVITPPSPLPSPAATRFVIDAVQQLVQEHDLAPAGFAIVVDPRRLTPVHLISGPSEYARGSTHMTRP